MVADHPRLRPIAPTPFQRIIPIPYYSLYASSRGKCAAGEADCRIAGSGGGGILEDIAAFVPMIMVGASQVLRYGWC